MAAGRQLKKLATLRDLRKRVEVLAEALESRTAPTDRRDLLRSMRAIFVEIDEVVAYELAGLDPPPSLEK
jgi:hypothetical protein